jgi:4-hydroxy-tetrahydrodipicolinate synthase
MQVDWHGVYPAVTTEFELDGALDLAATEKHVEALIAAGVHGLIMLGTVGENSVQTPEEKRAVLETTVRVAAGRVPVLSGVAENSTAAACRFAADCEKMGLDGLMVLPAMVYKSDSRETMTHFRAVAAASGLPIMVYNNPVSYGVDVTPEMFAELADVKTIVALKESSDDPRRITDIVNACGDRFVIFCGVDDLVLEAVALGAVGWVSGFTDAFPEESVHLWNLLKDGRYAEALPLYRWFTPILHLDCHVKLVQYIKLAQAMNGLGSETVRPPRLPLEGEERRKITALIQAAIDSRPRLAAE